MSAEGAEQVVALFDSPARSVGWDEVASWPAGLLDALKNQGMLVRTADVREVTCDSCDERHGAEVVWHAGTPFIVCRQEGRCEIDPKRLQRWELNRDAFARSLSESISGTARAVEPGRLWNLGTVSISGARRTVYLARGLDWRDGAEVLRRMQTPVGKQPAVVLSAHAGPLSSASDRGPSILSLVPYLTMQRGGPVLRGGFVDELAPVRRPARAARPLSLPLGASWTDAFLVVEPEHLRVRVWRGTRVELDERVPRAETGFEDRRSGGPNDSWALLQELAENRGLLPHATARKKDKPRVAKLRTILKELLPIEANPIPFEDGRYSCLFRIRSEGSFTFPQLPTGVTWGDVTLTLEARGELRVEIKDRTMFYEMEELGLAGSDGETTPTGKCLLDLLRGGGVVRDTEDEDMLNLASSLRRLDIPGEPLAADPVKDQPFKVAWRPAFRLRSNISR